MGEDPSGSTRAKTTGDRNAITETIRLYRRVLDPSFAPATISVLRGEIKRVHFLLEKSTQKPHGTFDQYNVFGTIYEHLRTSANVSTLSTSEADYLFALYHQYMGSPEISFDEMNDSITRGQRLIKHPTFIFPPSPPTVTREHREVVTPVAAELINDIDLRRVDGKNEEHISALSELFTDASTMVDMWSYLHQIAGSEHISSGNRIHMKLFRWMRKNIQEGFISPLDAYILLSSINIDDIFEHNEYEFDFEHAWQVITKRRHRVLFLSTMISAVIQHREPVMCPESFMEIMDTDETITPFLMAPLVCVGDYSQPAHGEDFSRLYYKLSVIPFRTHVDAGFS